MRHLTMDERKSHAMFLAQDLEREGIHVVADFDDGEGEETYRTALEIYDAFTTCDVWWCEWYKNETWLGRVLVIPSNDVDLISDYTYDAEGGTDPIGMLLKKIGWMD